MKPFRSMVLTLVLASLSWSIGCGGAEEAATKPLEEIKKQYMDRAEGVQ